MTSSTPITKCLYKATSKIQNLSNTTLIISLQTEKFHCAPCSTVPRSPLVLRVECIARCLLILAPGCPKWHADRCADVPYSILPCRAALLHYKRVYLLSAAFNFVRSSTAGLIAPACPLPFETTARLRRHPD